MDFSFHASDQAILNEFRDYLDRFDPAVIAAATSFDILDMDGGYEFRRQLGRDGWLGLSWPTEFGGRGASAIQEWLVAEELASRRLPLPGLSVTSIGPTLIRVGSDYQKDMLLEGLRTGELLFCLGYTEPGAGSDLASLRSTAKRVGDKYIVNGHKIFTSGAHHASHIWVAARTDPDAVKWAGISVLIVPTDAPGVTITPLITQAGARTNQVFLDEVEIPVENLVGEENRGWDIVKMALDFERTALIQWAALARDVWDMARTLGLPSSTTVEQVASQNAWAELAVDAELARVLLLRAAWMVDNGEVPKVEASMAKVWVTESRLNNATTALAHIGEAGQFLTPPGERASKGDFAWIYLFSPVKRFGGGTNEIQKRIISRERLRRSAS